MKEVWKDISDFKGKYEVSSYGRIRNSKTQNILKQRHGKDGYLKINLCKKGSNRRITCAVHRLVLENFNSVDGMELLQVNHIDEIKDNNKLENLEWTTSRENINYGL